MPAPSLKRRIPIMMNAKQIVLEWHFSLYYLLCVYSVAEFSVSICSTPKFICSSDDGVPRLLITENDTSYKSNIDKNRMM